MSIACGARRDEQLGLRFDTAESERRKAAGQARVERSPWIKSAVTVIERLARALDEFTADDLRREAAASGLEDPHHPNAWGAALATAARRGCCEMTDRTRPSDRVAAHRHRNPIWRSLLRSAA